MLRRITAKDLMNPDVLTVQEDMTLAGVARFLVDNEISGAPVEDSSGRLVGVVSLRDLARAAAGAEPPEEAPAPEFYLARRDEPVAPEELEALPRKDREVSLREVMTPVLFAVSEETPASEVARTMIDEHIHRLLVTRDEQLVGIVTTTDLLGLLVEEER